MKIDIFFEFIILQSYQVPPNAGNGYTLGEMQQKTNKDNF